MSFLDRLFRKKNQKFTRAPIKFGRFNEGLRLPERSEAWDIAMDLFQEDNFLASLDKLFYYLNDPESDNVSWTRGDNKIEFRLLQGSMVVQGWANPLEFQAQANICHFNLPNEALFSSLLQANYDLTYCKYVLQDQAIVLKFNSTALDASPHKVYQGLRELALLGDKQDDLLHGEFGKSLSLDLSWIQPLSIQELNVKQAFLKAQLSELDINYRHCALDAKEYAGAFAYLILNTCYKLDYLLRPEGELMDLFETVHRGYFGPKGAITHASNADFFERIQRIGSEREQLIQLECYSVNYTFGYTAPVSLERVQSFIHEEVEKMDWYVQEGHREIGLAIPGYIVGYSLFHYALPQPLPELFGLYYEISEYEFFEDLGFSPPLIRDGRLEESLIINRIHDILKQFNGMSKTELREQLRFESIYHFAKSFLRMIGQITLQ